ncbi:MAG: DUF1294 domain-containing protein [Clostridium sp.]|nr:DUF1294 domain-containing protein [Clostridium sp.]
MKEYLLYASGIYLLLVNLWAFVLMGIDKRRARKDLWRIKERTLFLPVLLGGGVGGILGMKVFHHKTKHWYFRFGFPVILILEIAGTVWLVWYFVFR